MDEKGTRISTKNKVTVKSIEIKFLTHNEILLMDKEQGGVQASYFKGIIKIEDGYL
ncbi:hypothetical protein JHD50_04160 [Sulfurimonas sp. MAG313]|nr:hypothetical protein [Sulfurimonas sp. MAG313]MDF1880505.1 hypothetical protein [Sulfurimonas sp. MAG313]